MVAFIQIFQSIELYYVDSMFEFHQLIKISIPFQYSLIAPSNIGLFLAYSEVAQGIY